MITETVSATEIEKRRADGWQLIKENIIGGKVRSAVMQKAGDPLDWFFEEERIRQERLDRLTHLQRRIAKHRDHLRRRGYDI